MVLTVAAAAIMCAAFFGHRGLTSGHIAGFMLAQRKPFSFIRHAQAIAWGWMIVAIFFSAAAGFVVGRG